MPSIKVLNIVLVLLCIVITAFICTFLAISSSNVALDDTKESRDTSVASAFAVGEESVQNRTDEYLEYLLTSTTDYLMQFLKPQREVATEFGKNIESNSWDDVKRWEWHRLETYYWRFYHLRHNGNTGVGFSLRNHLMIIPYEDVATINNKPEEYHSLKLLWNYGDEHPWGGVNRSFAATMTPGTGQPLRVSSFSDFNFNRSSCNFSAPATNGAVPDEPCYADTVPDPTKGNAYQISKFIPPGLTLWTPPVIIDEYLTLTSLTPIYMNGVHSGCAYSGADLRFLSHFLQKVQVSGPVEGYPSRGRVFITVRGSWLDPRAVGLLLGSSHGTPNPAMPKVGTPITPLYSSDSIVRQVALAGQNGHDVETIALTRNTSVLNISTGLAPGGEDFFYRVGIKVDPYGIDWYLHVVIDRAYILGSIDRKTAETKDAIHTAEKKVDDDLNTARTLLYILVAVVSVVLIVASVVFVLRIIEPLVVLEREMAMVAVMKLEGVDTERPLSSLQEVRLMQRSFQQMMKNLVEYRNYMPASVLQDDDEQEESESVVESQRSSTTTELGKRIASGVISSRASSLLLFCTKSSLYGTEAKHKKVTLMTCNIVSFLNDPHLQILTAISNYLGITLAEVKATHGIPDSFSGDRLYVSWNGVRPCASHRTQAYTCAKAITKNTTLGRTFSIGIVSGDVKCGNMGCDGMKKFSFVGSLASWVHVVERVGRLRGADIAVGPVVEEELVSIVYMRSIQHILYTKHSSKVLMVFEAGDKKDIKEEEWMYQMESGDSNDPNTAFNTCYSLFMKGNVASAAKLLADVTSSDLVVTKFRERVAKAAKNDILTEALGHSDVLF